MPPRWGTRTTFRWTSGGSAVRGCPAGTGSGDSVSKPRSGDFAPSSRGLPQGLVVHKVSPGGVDEDGSVLHQRKRAAVDHMAGGIQRGRVQRNHIAFGPSSVS